MRFVVGGLPVDDVAPSLKANNEASQAMLIVGGNRMSQISSCLDAAPAFHLTREDALEIANNLKVAIQDNWDIVCNEAQLTEIDRSVLWGRQFLNPYSIVGLV